MLPFCREKMIGFEISHNGKTLAVVGAGDLIALNAVLMACGDLSGRPDVVRLFIMNVLGFAKGSNENTTLHHTWNVNPENGEFVVGDTIRIRIVETMKATPPTSSQELENEDAEPPAGGDGKPMPQA